MRGRYDFSKAKKDPNAKRLEKPVTIVSTRTLSRTSSSSLRSPISPIGR